MAKAEQIKSLIQSHLENDRERFLTIAMQVAAHEARQGHNELAQDIRTLVDQSKVTPLRVSSFKQGLDDLVEASSPDLRLPDLILSVGLRTRIERILREYRQQEKLKRHGLSNRRKILLAGPPGTGKTMTASVIGGNCIWPVILSRWISW